MHEPDKWVVIEIDGLKRILSSWVGGYLGSDEWRLSSGVEGIEEDVDFFLMKTQSGSTYKCLKKSEGFSYLSSSIYRDIKEQCEESGKDLKITSLSEENKK